MAIKNVFAKLDKGVPEDAMKAILEVAALKHKIRVFREKMGTEALETPGAQTSDWIRKFDELFGSLEYGL